MRLLNIASVPSRQRDFMVLTALALTTQIREDVRGTQELGALAIRRAIATEIEHCAVGAGSDGPLPEPFRLHEHG